MNEADGEWVKHELLGTQVAIALLVQMLDQRGVVTRREVANQYREITTYLDPEVAKVLELLAGFIESVSTGATGKPVLRIVHDNADKE